MSHHARKIIPSTVFTQNVPHDEAYGKEVIYDSRRTLPTESEVARIINHPAEKSSKYATNEITHYDRYSLRKIKSKWNKQNQTLL